MEFAKRMKVRALAGAFCLLIGVLCIVLSAAGMARDPIIQSFGAAFACIGAARLLRYYRLQKNPEAMRKREIYETDERNVLICVRAQSLAGSVYVTLTGLAVIAFFLTGQAQIAQILAYTVCAFLLIYLLCYAFMKRRY